jgi:hypothetical protein
MYVLMYVLCTYVYMYVCCTVVVTDLLSAVLYVYMFICKHVYMYICVYVGWEQGTVCGMSFGTPRGGAAAGGEWGRHAG